MFTSFLDQPWETQFFVMVAIFFSRAFMMAGGSALWIRFSKWARTRTIVREASIGSVRNDINNGLIILIVDAAVVVGALKIGLVRSIEHSNLTQFSTTFALFFVWLEIYFYYSHRLLHSPKLYWIHRHHHHSRATNPWTSLSFSITERLILLFGAVVIPGAVSQSVPFSLEAFSVYFLVNYALNVYGHLNVEIMPNRFLFSAPGKILNTTTYHALHHLRYRGHYGLFTQVFDRIHETRFADYEAMHYAAIKGQDMKRVVVA